ncbi:MAG: hypothetical protein IPK19_15540 [Chloroflexi bacterium]|nr:hypothetical protein [Chloroflexota bacterium]
MLIFYNGMIHTMDPDFPNPKRSASARMAASWLSVRSPRSARCCRMLSASTYRAGR